MGLLPFVGSARAKWPYGNVLLLNDDLAARDPRGNRCPFLLYALDQRRGKRRLIEQRWHSVLLDARSRRGVGCRFFTGPVQPGESITIPDTVDVHAAADYFVSAALARTGLHRNVAPKWLEASLWERSRTSTA